LKAERKKGIYSMSYIYLRGQKFEIKSNEEPVDLHIPEYNIIIKDTILREGVNIWANVNMYGADIGKDVKLASFVEIRSGVKLGTNTKVEPFVFIPEGVAIGDCVFIGPNTTFTNDLYPRSCKENKEIVTDYTITKTVIEDMVSIGAGSTIVCGITLAKGCMIASGSTIANSVGENELYKAQKATFCKKIDY
jgi:acetyltransferase-like isoleucine patch superfamily enzyme